MSHNFVKTIRPFEFQNHSYQNLLLLHKFTYHKSKLPYLLYFQHTLLIINYFLNIILVGKLFHTPIDALVDTNI